jgi:hypothetical protein
MAGDWLKVELTLPDKPEVHYIASVLKLDPDTVIGKLLRVWRWFNENTVDGRAHLATFATVDWLVGVVGFAEAMHFAHWLDQDGKTLTMPAFDKHTSESAKKRAESARRMNKSRGRNGDVALSAQQKRNSCATEAQPEKEKRREEERREEMAAAVLDAPASARITPPHENHTPPTTPAPNPNQIPKGKDTHHALDPFDAKVRQAAFELASAYQMRRYSGPNPSAPWYPGLLREIGNLLEVSKDLDADKAKLLDAIQSRPTATLPRDANFGDIAKHCGVKRRGRDSPKDDFDLSSAVDQVL